MKEGLSDFLKLAYKYGKVIELKEAFEEYPVEEEWHEGKIENVLNDNKVYYNINYDIGDIVFVAFEENSLDKPVIIGLLYANDNINSTCDISAQSLVATVNSKLPEDTIIYNTNIDNGNILNEIYSFYILHLHIFYLLLHQAYLQLLKFSYLLND